MLLYAVVYCFVVEDQPQELVSTTTFATFRMRTMAPSMMPWTIIRF